MRLAIIKSEIPDPKKILEQIEIGTEIELEHTKSRKEARKIALDHLKEFPDYYTRLVRMEKEAKGEMKKAGEKDKISKVMREFYAGKLKDSHGKIVTDRKQALAIAYSYEES